MFMITGEALRTSETKNIQNIQLYFSFALLLLLLSILLLLLLLLLNVHC